MMEMADETILMVDSSKFGTQAFSQIAPLAEANCVISDSKMEEQTKKQLEENWIKVIIAHVVDLALCWE